MARESHLPLRVVTRIAFAARDGLLKGKVSSEEGEKMRRAMRAHDGQQRIEPALAERPRLFERPGCDHVVETRINPREKFGSGRLNEKSGTTRGVK